MPELSWREFPPFELPPILKAALSEFVEHGYEGTSVRKIATEVGVSVPALYYHYENKQAMLTAMLSHAMDLVLAHTEEALKDAGDDPRQRFCFLIEAITLYITNHRELAFLDSEIRSLTPANRAAYAGRRDQLEKLLTSVVEDGCQAGYFATELPRACSRAILSMVLGIASWYRRDGVLTPREVADQYVEIALGSVRAAAGKAAASLVDTASA